MAKYTIFLEAAGKRENIEKQKRKNADMVENVKKAGLCEIMVEFPGGICYDRFVSIRAHCARSCTGKWTR